METIREIALRTYKDATAHGMMDTSMNWHIWKRAFDIAESELKKLRVGDVSICTCGTEEYSENEPRSNGMTYCGICDKPY